MQIMDTNKIARLLLQEDQEQFKQQFAQLIDTKLDFYLKQLQNDTLKSFGYKIAKQPAESIDVKKSKSIEAVQQAIVDRVFEHQAATNQARNEIVVQFQQDLEASLPKREQTMPPNHPHLEPCLEEHLGDRIVADQIDVLDPKVFTKIEDDQQVEKMQLNGILDLSNHPDYQDEEEQESQPSYPFDFADDFEKNEPESDLDQQQLQQDDSQSDSQVPEEENQEDEEQPLSEPSEEEKEDGQPIPSELEPASEPEHLLPSDSDHRSEPLDLPDEQNIEYHEDEFSDKEHQEGQNSEHDEPVEQDQIEQRADQLEDQIKDQQLDPEQQADEKHLEDQVEQPESSEQDQKTIRIVDGIKLVVD